MPAAIGRSTRLAVAAVDAGGQRPAREHWLGPTAVTD